MKFNNAFESAEVKKAQRELTRKFNSFAEMAEELFPAEGDLHKKIGTEYHKRHKELINGIDPDKAIATGAPAETAAADKAKATAITATKTQTAGTTSKKIPAGTSNAKKAVAGGKKKSEADKLL